MGALSVLRWKQRVFARTRPACRGAGLRRLRTHDLRTPGFGLFGDQLREHADGFPLQMGFEVAHPKLIELGVEEWAPYLCFDGSNEFLLELDPHAGGRDFEDYERTIYELQGLGYSVIIAHPERYRAIQRDPDIAERLVRMGCHLQASVDFMGGGRFGKEKKPAKKLFERNLYRYIASDAHKPEHYKYLTRAIDKFPRRGAHFAV